MSFKSLFDKLIMKFVLVLFFSAIISSNLIAQHFNAKLYNESEGLFQKNISDIITDADGFLWLSTESGLVRFDGRNFNTFFPKELRYKNLGYQKLKKYQNGVFLNYEQNGCLYFDFDTYQYKPIVNEPVYDIQPINENTLIVLTQQGWLKKMVNGKVRLQIKIDSDAGSIMTFFKGDVYVSLPKFGLIAFDCNDLKTKKKIKEIKPDGYKNSFERSPDNLIFVTDSKAFNIAGKETEKVSFKTFNRNKEDLIAYYKYFNKERQYIIVNNKYLAKITSNKNDKLLFDEILNCELLSMHIIDTNNIYVGTGQGLLLISKQGNTSEKIDDNISLFENTLRIRRSIVETKSGALILMGYPYNVFYKNGRYVKLGNEIISFNQAILHGDYIYAAVDLGGFQKINIKNGKTEQLAFGQNKKSYLSVYFDTLNHRMLAGGNGFLAIHDLTTGQTKTIDFFKNYNTIRAILYDEQTKKYWFGTANGLFVCDQQFEGLTAISTQQQNEIAVQYSALLMPFGRNEIWVAHDNGVSVYDRKSRRYLRDLPSQIFLSRKTVSLIEDNYHRIWMGTYLGIIGFDPQNDNFIRLTSKNNLFNTEFNFTSVTKISNGNLIFGGLSGYDIINPTLYSFDAALNPPIVTGYDIYTSNDTIFKKFNQEVISIDVDNQYLQIFLGTSNILKSNKSTLEYRIDDGPWLNTNDKFVVSLFNLKPGNHLFYVRSFDEYGRISEMKPIAIKAFVTFYKSNLFLLGLIILVIAGFSLFIYAIYRKNIIERITKENISMDLHDEVGTMLTRALFLLKMENKGEGTKALSYLNDALFSLRAYINSMNKPKFKAEQLSDKINEMAISILGSDMLKFYSNMNNYQNVEINNALFRDINLCVFESLNNIQKHAQSDLVIINLMINAKKIIIKVIDNGCFNEEILNKSVGNGIQNINKRVARNHGFVKFEKNTQGKGLQIVFTFPIK